MKYTVILAVFLSSAWLAAAQRVKIIDLSWSNPTIAFLQKNLAEMEKTSPLDGITIRIRGEQIMRNGKKYFAGESLWTASKVEFNHFAKDISALKKLPFKKFTDNFYYSTTYNYDLDWYNDAQWAQAAANFGVASRVCREAGLKGIMLDLEEYRKRFWDYRNLVKPEKDYRATRQIAYQRGQQWGREVFGNYPEITLFMPYMFSIYRWNLSKDFLNGILSVMPPKARIIEGYEHDGYQARTPEEFHAITRKYLRNARIKADPENRQKYLSQVELAPAFYFDRLVRGKHFEKAKAECGGLNNLLRRNLNAAMQEAGSYIWFYSEKGCWWKNPHNRKASKLWEEQVPGITETLRKTIEQKLVFKKENLLKNPDLKDSSAWYPWQIETDQNKELPGTVTVGDGKVVFKNVTFGCIAQRLTVKPGEYYVLQFRGMNRSVGTAFGAVSFIDDKDKWLSPEIYRRRVPLPDSGNMEEVSYLFIVPPGAAMASITVGVENQGPGNTGETVFTGVQLIKY